MRLTLMLALAAGVTADRARAGHDALHAADPEKQAYAKIVEARGSARAARYLEALNHLDDAVALAERLEGRLPLALALHNKGEVELLRGRPLDALKAYYRVLGVYTRLGHQGGVTRVQRRIDTLTRLVRKPRGPAEPPAQGTPPAKTRDSLSPIDQAVERIRSRVRSGGQPAPEERPSTPVQATPPEESPPAPVQVRTPEEPAPAPVQVKSPEEPPPASVQVARTEPRAPSDSPRQWAYVETLKRKISGNSRYPDYAKRTGQQGIVDLVFAVQESGGIDDVRLSKSSGFIVLDVEALRNVRESAPFGPVPVSAGPLTVRLTFSYKLPAASDGAP